MEPKTYDILILGGGPAGLTAAIYTSRADINTLVVAGNPPGGQLTTTTGVENFPGFPSGVQGPDLISLCRSQAERFGTKCVDENVVAISGNVEGGFVVETDGSQKFKGKCVLVATGASAKWLGLESEQRLRGKGVSACATCDGFFFKGKVVAVVGGGDASMEEASYLTRFATKVYLIVRGAEGQLRASKIMLKRAQDNPKIEFVYNSEVLEVLGKDFVAGLRIANTQTKEESVLSDVAGLFVAIGHTPNTKFLEGFVDLGKFGYVNVTDGTHTSKEGVFVAGDVSDFRYRQAITAAGYGCMASLDAERFLAGLVG